jgi:hypothetical protein
VRGSVGDGAARIAAAVDKIGASEVAAFIGRSGEAMEACQQADIKVIAVERFAREAEGVLAERVDHLPVKKTYSWRDATDKERNIEGEVYDNYREVQGVMTPHTITRFYNGDMSNQRFLTQVSYNQGIADSQFDPAQGLKKP